MDWFGFTKQAQLVVANTWRRFYVHRDLPRGRAIEPHGDRKNHRDPKRHRNHVYLYAIGCATLFSSPAYSNTVGGVSATANPIANSSGSVTNQAIQVLQGPYITNTYSNGISCQGPTLNFTPFVTASNSWQVPYESHYMDNVYDMRADDNGKLLNPGDVLYQVPVRTGQKNSHNINFGLSATLSIPLDGGLQERCKTAVDTQTAIQQQILATKRLDFEIGRLKHCGNLKKQGIMFHPKSRYFKVCEDVILVNPPGHLPQHTHSIPISSKPAVKQEAHDSAHAEQGHAHAPIRSSSSSQVRQAVSSGPSSQSALSVLEASRQAALLIEQKKLQQSQ